MASPGSPTSPMAASRDATPELLTPRSKIKALLATVESSDDETGASKTTATTTKASVRARNSPLSATRRRTDDGSDSGSDVPIRPRGKLASRMQGAAAALNQRAINEEQPEADGNKGEDLEYGQADGRGQDGGDGNDEGEELPVASRRLQQRVARSPSPALFVSSPARSAASPSRTASDGHVSGEEIPATKADRFKALVERKRQERLQREAEEEARRAKRQTELEQLHLDDEDDGEEEDDGFTGTADQQARPVRRAGKKAIEEMNRETQRMARSMQLAHEAKTRKKVTKASLFERFNYRPAGTLAPAKAPMASSRQASPKSSADKEGDTPPSSPPAKKKNTDPSESAKATMDPETRPDVPMNDLDDDDLPPLEEIMISEPRTTIDKGKGKMPAFATAEPLNPSLQQKRRVRVRLPVPSSRPMPALDSDDELQITATAKDKMNAVFDSVPLVKSQDSQSMQALRALALVRSPGKDSRRNRDQAGMTPGELQTYLQQKARQQAKVERDRRLELLKAQGIKIQSAEERERQMQEVEDILAKAREEGERIGQEEKAAAKREREERGEMDPLAWDSSDADEEYEENGGNDDDDDDDDDADEGSAIELSGSEDEVEDGDMDVDVEQDASEAAAAFLDATAELDDAEDMPIMKRTRARKQVAVISDDEDEAEDSIKATPEARTSKRMVPPVPNSDPIASASVLQSAKKTFIPGLPVQDPAELGLTQIFAGTMDSSPMNDNPGPDPVRAAPEVKTPAKTSRRTASFIPNSDPVAPTSVLRSAKKTFIPGLPVQGPAGLGLTQIFAGTMDGTPASQGAGPTPSIMPDFTQIPSPGFSPARTDDDMDDMVIDSQTEVEQARADGPSQFSSTIDPTQDGGLQTQTPLLQRFVDLPSTVDTMANDLHGATIPESPLILKGRLRRKMDLSPGQQDYSTQDTIPLSSESNIFSRMKRGARKQKLQEDFDKKKSKAKEMVEEQAEESEDEYAGLGGADGEISDDDDSAASVHEFLDDAAGNDADERKMAAFFADQEVANDQKQVEKLYKDITSGRLRKRGADYDLSDSDDGGEALRRMKRRQFDKMQKSLFADERVKKIAENPGNLAFIRSIEDRGSDDEIILADASGGGSQSEDAQTRESSVPAELKKASSRAVTGGRPAAHLRRTKDGKKPSNLGEIRETVSDLLDERSDETFIPATAEDGDGDGDSGDEEAGPAVARAGSRTRRSPSPRRSMNTVVDRMKKKPAVASTSSRMAFATGGAASSGSSSFKVPALLRRATTNSSLISGPSSSTSVSASSAARNDAGGSAAHHSGGFGADAKIKKGAGKKSGVHGFTRDLERNARMKENERRREERKIKGAESRAGLVGGLLGKGTFE